VENLQWKRDILGSYLQINNGTNQIGNINWSNILSSTAQAIINGRFFTLKRDTFLSKIEIFDSHDQSLLGTVMVNVFNPKSDVVINGKRYEFEIKNFWQSKWSWKFDGKEIIVFNSNKLIFKEKGEINILTTYNEETEILILLGLFVRNQFVLYLLLLLIIVLFIVSI